MENPKNEPSVWGMDKPCRATASLWRSIFGAKLSPVGTGGGVRTTESSYAPGVDCGTEVVVADWVSARGTWPYIVTSAQTCNVESNRLKQELQTIGKRIFQRSISSTLYELTNREWGPKGGDEGKGQRYFLGQRWWTILMPATVLGFPT